MASESILRRLLRRPSVVVSLLIIAGTALIAVFAYALAPDATPNAARSIVELGAKPPGFTIRLLPVPRTVVPEPKSGLSRLFTGTPDRFQYVPVNGYFVEGNTLAARHYIDDGLEDTLRFSLTTLVPEAGSQPVPAYLHQTIRKHTFYLGTDRYGRDILSRLLVGARVSMAVGTIAVLLSLSIGLFLGLLAGYYRGLTDSAVMFVINILWAIPTLLLVFALTLALGKGFWQIFIAIGLTLWVSAARLIRGQVLVLRELDYVQAAKALGLSDFRILTRHILPNIAGPVLVLAAGNFATAILLEAGLSFLGLGLQPPAPSWGSMIKDHYNFLVTNRPFLALIPGLAILVLVYALNILGNGLRDALDVKR
jgi:peptide/nickel transport system permease protein